MDFRNYIYFFKFHPLTVGPLGPGMGTWVRFDTNWEPQTGSQQSPNRLCTGSVQALYRLCTGSVQAPWLFGTNRVPTGSQQISTAFRYCILYGYLAQTHSQFVLSCKVTKLTRFLRHCCKLNIK